MDKQTNTQNELELHRPNQTIAICPQKGKLTTVMRRMFVAMLHFSQEDGVRSEYSRPLAELSKNAGLKRQTMEELREALRAMREMSIDWNDETPERYRWRTTGLIGEAGITDNKITRSSTVEWQLPSPVLEALAKREYFTSMMLHIVTSMKSGASIALYEICAAYATNPGHLTKRHPWEWWRPRLTGKADAEGLSDKETEYKYFKRDVLTSAIEEINRLTDIEVELVEHKQGRRVAEIQFKTKRKPQALPLADAAPVEPRTEYVEEMVKIGVAELVARDIESRYPQSEITKYLDMTHKGMKKQGRGKIEEPAAFFVSAIRNKYADAKPVRQVAAVTTPSKPPSDAVPEEKPTVSRLKSAFATYQALEVDQQQAIFAEFAADRRADSVRKALREKGLASTTVKTAFSQFYADRLGLVEQKAA